MTDDTHTSAPPFEPRWPSVVAIGVAIALYVSLPDTIISDSYGSGAIRFIVPALELALLIPLAVAAPDRLRPLVLGARRRRPAPAARQPEGAA
jgi:hypothetical protein